jgi:hypothetical protein
MSRRVRSTPVTQRAARGFARCAVAFATAAGCVATLPAHSGSLTTSSLANFVEPGAGYLPLASNLPFTLFSVPPVGDSIGGFVGGVGAKASGSLSLGLDALVEVIWLPKYSFAYKTVNATTASWSGDLTVGESFFLTGTALPLGMTKLNVTDPGIWANLILRESLHLATGAEACLGGCVKVGFKVNVEQGQTIASLNQAGSGDLHVLGQKVADALPSSYSTAGNTVKIEAALPNFSKTLSNVPPGGQTGFSSTQKLAALNVDVTQILANVVGLPIPLSGSVLGFDYSLIEALVGLGADLRHEFDLDVTDLYSGYVFSSPVQVKQGAGWGAPTTSVSVAAGETVELRTAQPTKTLGVIPSFGIGTHIESALDVVPYAAASVRALELSGHGLDFGPVLNEGTKGPLAAIEIAADSIDRSEWVDGNPFTLTFNPLTADASGIPLDLCAGVDCISSAFLPIASGTGGGWTTGRIVKVRDPTPECLLRDPENCVIDETFAPLPVSYRDSSRTGGEELEFVFDPGELARLLALEDFVGGAESDESMQRESLQRLGFNLDDMLLPRRIGFGAPAGPIEGNAVAEFAFSVPEPGSIALLAAALVGLVLVRRPRS